MIALEILLLFTPAMVYALLNGRNGLKHPNPSQVKNVAYIMFLSASVVRFGALYFELIPFAKTVYEALLWYLKAFLVAITGYGLFFPPLMNFVLTRKNMFWNYGTFWHKVKYCLDHLSPTAWPDKFFLKYRIGWKTRLIGYVALFVCSILWFML